jgi:membrane protease YdiL (CAAX protease family)
VSSFLNAVAVFIIVWSLSTWLVHGLRVYRGRRAWLVWEPRRAVPWGAIDIVLAVLVLAMLAALVMGGIGQMFPESKTLKGDNLPPNLQLALLAGESALKIFAMCVSILLISLRLRATAADWGWEWNKLRVDVRVGIVAFTMIVPPVYLLQGLTVVGMQWESKHPLIEKLKESPGDLLYIFSFIAAVMVAPVVEEWTFRVLIQGWLEKCCGGRHSFETLLVGDAADDAADNSVIDLSSEVAFQSKFQAELRGWRSWLPIAISAAMFAAVHVAHGPDFIALFVLALGQGYIYQRTHRVMPVILIHFLLNLLSMLAVRAAMQTP